MLISIVSLYNYDKTLFDDMVIPEGMDKATIINMIMWELAELSILYSDPNILKEYMKYWSMSRLSVWEHLWNLQNEEYDPLDNYNRTDTTTTDHGHKLTIDRANNSTRNESGNNGRSDAKHEYTYGYNSSNRAPTGDTMLNETINYQQAGTENNTSQDVHTNAGRDVETRHGKGNIGVTTYGKMISEELELRPKLNMYKFIVTEFKEEFCIMVY